MIYNNLQDKKITIMAEVKRDNKEKGCNRITIKTFLYKTTSRLWNIL